ncbi:DUF819 family protein [candidate division KSB1 bacterium]|nr:DUF819 family protein [candidate division KSB1 bacterium]
MITDPMAIFAVCAGICALVFWSTEQSWAKKFYKIIPSIALIYYIPTFATTFGILPSSSPVYVWMKDYLLPFSLFILMITTDLPTILKIGPKALAMMAIGTLGVVVGGPVALLIFKQWVPPDTWKGLAALSGSWIGGGANFAAIKESVGAPDSIIGPIIIVDTAVGYTWMGVLLFLANHQKGIDRWNKADTRVLEDLNRRLKDFQKNQMKPISLPDASAIIAIGILGAVVCQFLAGIVYGITDPFLKEYLPTVATIFSKFTWTVILISTIGILLSFTPLKKIEGSGASKLGYAALYLFLTSIGAKADLAGIAAAPILLAVGAVWIIIHVSFLIIGARLLRAPLFLLAVGSQANIGGAASAPIVAGAYYQAMAPVGLLMGIFGYVLGNYAGLLCAYFLQLVGG